MAEAIRDALSMSQRERVTRWESMIGALREQDVSSWVAAFLKELDGDHEEPASSTDRTHSAAEGLLDHSASSSVFAGLGEASSDRTTAPPQIVEDRRMSKKPTGAAAGNSEAIRIYERMEEERKQKVQAKAEANKPKKVSLAKVKFLDEK